MRKVLMTAMTVMLVAGVAMAEGAKGKGGKNSSMTGEVTAVDVAAGKLSIKDAKGFIKDWIRQGRERERLKCSIG